MAKAEAGYDDVEAGRLLVDFAQEAKIVEPPSRAAFLPLLGQFAELATNVGLKTAHDAKDPEVEIHDAKDALLVRVTVQNLKLLVTGNGEPIATVEIYWNPIQKKFEGPRVLQDGKTVRRSALAELAEAVVKQLKKK